MTLKHTVMLGLLGGVLVMLGTRVTFSVAPIPDTPPSPTPAAASAVALSLEIDRLHDRLRAPVVPLRSARNPFAYGTSAPAHRRVAATRGANVITPESSPVVAAVPTLPYKLVGLAEETGEGGPVRTAILAGPQGLVFAKVGDAVGTYRVTTIGEAGVELASPVPSSSPVLLPLE